MKRLTFLETRNILAEDDAKRRNEVNEMDGITKQVSSYVQEMGISIPRIAERTGIPYGVIYPSLCPIPNRKLRADEFLKICVALEVEPSRFWHDARMAEVADRT